MKKSKKLITILTVAILCGMGIGPNVIFSATTPSLGTAGSFGILSSTFTRNVGVTTINGDVGYTTISGGGTNTISGTVYVPAPAQTGTDQASALNNLNSQACTYTFASGAIDLATDVGHGVLGIYTPGVYCTSAGSAASVGTAGITLNGVGTYIFRINGALTTVDNSQVSLTGGASACDVFWTPTSATTLGANTTFIGTVIDDSGITVGNSSIWSGRALNFATTITTDTNTITVPTCGGASFSNFRVIKTVSNVGGGTALNSDFNIYVKLAGINVSGSPAQGSTTPGTLYLLSAGIYNVSEDTNLSYSRVFSGGCDLTGNITLTSGGNQTCTVTNTYIIPTILAFAGGNGPIVGSFGVINNVVNPVYLVQATTSPIIASIDPVSSSTLVLAQNLGVVPSVTSIPRLPDTGFPPQSKNISVSIIFSIISLIILVVVSRKLIKI